jgi:chromosome segregation ATPase
MLKRPLSLKQILIEWKKNENDIKIKIALYSERFPEFENTYKTTYEMQQRFKQEIVKTASRSKTYYNQNTALKQKNERIDAATLEILSENNDLKKKIEETRGIKDKIRNKCIELQKELKEKDKELAALQAQ